MAISPPIKPWPHGSIAPQPPERSANAVGDNPIAYLIPCHRVIRASGELGGYRWGLDRKLAMLGWEASRSHDGTALENEQLTLEGV